MRGIVVPPEEIEGVEAAIPGMLQTMDGWIRENDGYIAGDDYTICDLLAVCELAHLLRFTLLDISPY
jgi:hypothetical protein